MGVSPYVDRQQASWIPSEIPLTPDGVVHLRKSYSWFALSLLCTCFGGWLGTRNDAWLSLFSHWSGWLFAASMLYLIPLAAVAARSLRKGDSWPAALALLGSALLSGFVMAPFARLASQFFAPAASQSFAVTVIVFMALSGYILSRNGSFPARRALLLGLISSAAATSLSAFVLGFHWIGFPVAIFSGVIGVLILINAIIDLLHATPRTAPVNGALLLFAGTCSVAFTLTQIGLRATRRA